MVLTRRIEWIDEFKGFVLLLVCLYHVEQSFPCASMGMLHLSALRMSAFFFISGVLFSTRRFNNFKSYFVHKTHVLFLPYVALSLLFLLLDPVIYNFDLFPKAPRMTVMNVHPVITGGQGLCWLELCQDFRGREIFDWFRPALVRVYALFREFALLPCAAGLEQSGEGVIVCCCRVCLGEPCFWMADVQEPHTPPAGD